MSDTSDIDTEIEYDSDDEESSVFERTYGSINSIEPKYFTAAYDVSKNKNAYYILEVVVLLRDLDVQIYKPMSTCWDDHMISSVKITKKLSK